MAYEMTSPNPGELDGISARTNEIHHDKLYAGYVAKRGEVTEKQKAFTDEQLAAANQIYSEWRGLKEGETFATNGMILHEVFFDILGGDGIPSGSVKDAIVAQWGTWERFVGEFTATGMAARGWAILSFDSSDSKLHIYAADAQNHGGVWGAMPILPMDVYEHGYFLDFGSDRKSYIAAFMKNVNWARVEDRYKKAAGL
jgi:superoxide dismutase, Fe-Mn family